MKPRKIVGVIPAAGIASRLGELPLSKELYPIGTRGTGRDGGGEFRVACQDLLEQMHFAGVRTAYFVLRHGKWDIPGFLGDGSDYELRLAYLMMNEPFGVPFTVDQAHPFVRDDLVAFGFPDILLRPDDAMARLLRRQRTSGAEVVLGAFPTEESQKADMIELDERGKVDRIIVKPKKSSLSLAWILAVWTPAFTEFLHDRIGAHRSSFHRGPSVELSGPDQELQLGEIIQEAIDAGLGVESVVFPEGAFLDIGTPGDLARAASFLGQDPSTPSGLPA